jgi:hypothetical protein
MEAVLDRLSNQLAAKKGSWPITIKGTITNEDGTFLYNLKEPLKFDDDGTYLIWLWNFTCWSNFPNVVNSPAHLQNNKFFYSGSKNGEREIIIPTALHDVDSYNAFIHSQMIVNGDATGKQGEEYPITLSYDLPTQ